MFCLHCHVFTRFRIHWVETCHCAEFRFLTWLKELQTEALWNCLNPLNVFFRLKQALTRITDHCRALLPPLVHCRALWQLWLLQLVEGLQLSAVTDKGLTDFPLERFNQLVSNTLRVPALAYESVTATELLALTLGEFEAAEIHDLLLVTQAVTAVRTDCETLKHTAVSQDWLPTTTVPGSMTDGLYGLRQVIPSPDSPCNCFSLAALHSRRCQNWRALKTAETLFPNCKMPHSSYTLAEFNCYGNCNLDTVEILTGLAFKGDVVTTGQTAQSMCFATTLTTAKEILDTGIIPISLFTNNQINNWFTPRSALLRAFQIYWSGYTESLSLQEPMTLIVYNPSVLDFIDCSSTDVQPCWRGEKGGGTDCL